MQQNHLGVEAKSDHNRQPTIASGKADDLKIPEQKEKQTLASKESSPRREIGNGRKQPEKESADAEAEKKKEVEEPQIEGVKTGSLESAAIDGGKQDLVEKPAPKSVDPVLEPKAKSPSVEKEDYCESKPIPENEGTMELPGSPAMK